MAMKRFLTGWILTALCFAHGGQAPVFKIGVGFGTGFGMTGGGLEMETPDLALLAGLGFGAANHKVWDVGARYYFRDRDKKFRPSVTATYAPVRVLSYSSVPLNINRQVVVMGYGLLLGLDHDMGRPGGFIASYGFGLLHPVYSQLVRDDYRDAGQSLPSQTLSPAISFGFKYQL